MDIVASSNRLEYCDFGQNLARQDAVAATDTPLEHNASPVEPWCSLTGGSNGLCLQAQYLPRGRVHVTYHIRTVTPTRLLLPGRMHNQVLPTSDGHVSFCWILLGLFRQLFLPGGRGAWVTMDWLCRGRPTASGYGQLHAPPRHTLPLPHAVTVPMSTCSKPAAPMTSEGAL